MKYVIKLNRGIHVVGLVDGETSTNNFREASQRATRELFDSSEADNVSAFVVYEDGSISEANPFFYAEKG